MSREAQPFNLYVKSLEQADHLDFVRRKRFRSKDRHAFEEQRRFLIERASRMNVVASQRDQGGQVFDLVLRDDQPALRNGIIASPPDIIFPNTDSTKEGRIRTRPAQFRMHTHAERNDLVPIRRPTFAEVSRFSTLDSYSRKHPEAAAAEGAAVEHRYAQGAQQIPNTGGSAIMNIWKPIVGHNSFSLGQMWIVADGPLGSQTVEAGWQIYPDYYTTTQAVLFCGTTQDGYQHYSYNNLSHDFVQQNSTLAPGTIIGSVSVAGGLQVEFTVLWTFSNGNWWLYIGSGDDNAQPVGYYPGALFNGGSLAAGAEQIRFGGEVAGTVGSFPAMGSGEFANAGDRHSAYQHNQIYYDQTGTAQSLLLVTDEHWPSEYTIQSGQDPAWGSFIFYGGPGGL